MKKKSGNDQKIHIFSLLAVILGMILLVLGLSIGFADDRKVRAMQTTLSPEVILTDILPTSAASPTATQMPAPTIQATATVSLELSPSPTALQAADWKDWPVLPESISQSMKDVYAAGKENDRKADRFSKVGDSNSVMPSFLSCFDYGELGYTIGDYTDLEEAIRNFQWSFSRESRAAINGTTAMALDTYHTYEDDICWPYESPTSCEYRLWEPSIAFISLGTNDVYMKIEDFDTHMRSLVQKSLDRFVVPILVTKADNLETDGSFNQAIVQIAIDYEVPLWNLWAAMDPLPNHGLRESDVHPSFSNVSLCDFSGEDLKTYGWTVRNLTGLQALDRVWRLLNP